MNPPGVHPGPPAAMARNQAVGIVLDWLLVDDAAVATVETLMAAHCTEKLEYRARQVTAANIFGPIVDEAFWGTGIPRPRASRGRRGDRRRLFPFDLMARLEAFGGTAVGGQVRCRAGWSLPD